MTKIPVPGVEQGFFAFSGFPIGADAGGSTAKVQLIFRETGYF
ncbi:hypothetical protein PAPH110629_04895 [Paenibacillus phoenicis]